LTLFGWWFLLWYISLDAETETGNGKYDNRDRRPFRPTETRQD
jgi:hypothetical protein